MNAVKNRLTYVLSIEVEQARFDTEDQQAEDGSVVGVSFEIRESIGAGNLPEQCDVRLRSASQQLNQRNNRADQHTAQQPRSKHAKQSRHCDDELSAVGSPQMAQLGDF